MAPKPNLSPPLPPSPQSLRRTSAPLGSEAYGVEPAHRPMDWLIFPTQSSLRYLDGSMPGDYGFDPLGLFDPASGGAGAMSQVGG